MNEPTGADRGADGGGSEAGGSGPDGAAREMVTVRILGEEYTLRSETSPAYTRRVAEYVDRMAREVKAEAGVMDSKRVAILAALAITDQLFRVKEGVDRVRDLVERRAERLTGEVLAAMDGDSGAS